MLFYHILRGFAIGVGDFVGGVGGRLRLSCSAWGVLSFASAKESTKGKQPGKPFVRERFPATLPKREGVFALLRRENATPSQYT